MFQLCETSDFIHTFVPVLSFGLLLVRPVSANYEAYRRTSIIIGVIVPMAVLLIVTIIFCCYLRQRRSSRAQNVQYPIPVASPSQQLPYPTDGTPFPPRYSEVGQIYPPPQTPYPPASTMSAQAPPPYPTSTRNSQSTEPTMPQPIK